MSRRIAIALLLVVAGVALAAASSDEADGGRRYTVELDNAFGMVQEGDVRVTGVNAGKVKAIELDERTHKALVEIEITAEGFGSFRSDAYCETRPQSLIGEYFIDCRPGTSDKPKLKPGSVIPVKQTETTVPLDLINNIMRRPYRERFSILLSELGAGLAARGPDLNETIRRAVPALRQVDRLLAILAEQRRTIRQLYDDAEEVM